MEISKLILNENNPRTITDENLEKLKNSIQSFEEMMDIRPIVIDENNVVLGGNMRIRALTELGYKEIPDTWIKRFEGLSEEKKKEFIAKDNIGFGDWNWEMLNLEWDIEKLAEWGLNTDIPEWDQGDDDEEKENKYSAVVEAPIYEPDENCTTTLPDCFDDSTYKKIIQQIDDLEDFSDDQIYFLKLAASRFIKFNYSKIADVYSKSDDKFKDMFERLALVIIDFDMAIEKSFLELTESIQQAYKNDKL